MKSIILLVLVSIVIVFVKESVLKRLFKQSKGLLEAEKESKERTKKHSKNFLIQLLIKSSWFHIIFFISAIIGGVYAKGFYSIVLTIFYLILMIFIVIFTRSKHKKYNQNFGAIEIELARQNTRQLQNLINNKSLIKTKNQKTFTNNYEVLEKQLALPMTATLIAQSVISILMWIGTF